MTSAGVIKKHIQSHACKKTNDYVAKVFTWTRKKIACHRNFIMDLLPCGHFAHFLMGVHKILIETLDVQAETMEPDLIIRSTSERETMV